MHRICFDEIVLSKQEFNALKRAAKRKDRVVVSKVKSLSAYRGLCYFSGTKPDGMGGFEHTADTRLLISDDGIQYVKWVKRNKRKSTLKELKEWIAIAISLVALIISILK